MALNNNGQSIDYRVWWRRRQGREPIFDAHYNCPYCHSRRPAEETICGHCGIDWLEALATSELRVAYGTQGGIIVEHEFVMHATDVALAVAAAEYEPDPPSVREVRNRR